MSKSVFKRIQVPLSEAQYQALVTLAEKLRISQAEILRGAAVQIHHLPNDLAVWGKYSLVEDTQTTEHKPRDTQAYKRGGSVHFNGLVWEIAAVLEGGLTVSRLNGKVTKFAPFAELEQE